LGPAGGRHALDAHPQPEIATLPGTVENEAFCMRLAKYLGLSAASVETTTVNGRKLIIVQRYDRVIHQDGSVQRLHQEDFCQATASGQTRSTKRMADHR